MKTHIGKQGKTDIGQRKFNIGEWKIMFDRY